MQQEFQDTNKAVARPTLGPAVGLPPSTNRSGGRPSNAQRFGGMHQRRDKRFPFAQRYLAEALPTLVPQAPPSIAEDPLKLWKEAVMLWLSWHSTQEKITAKMCKPGQDQSKIEALLDEADKLRSRAIELSENLVRQ